jgi:hypothetical protein
MTTTKSMIPKRMISTSSSVERYGLSRTGRIW